MKRLILAVALACATAPPAFAGSVLDRVRHDGVVRCAGEERPGVVTEHEDGTVTGLAVDLCRAVAVGVLGPDGRIAFAVHDSDRDYDAVRQGADDILFVSGTAMAEQGLTAFIVPGPVIYADSFALMVPDSSPAQAPADLAGETICLMIGSPAQRALEAAFARTHTAFVRLTFEEEVEMLDAYNVGRCQAMTYEATRLAALRQTTGVNRLRSRILSQPLGIDPVIGATGTADGQWSALVFWTMQALILDTAPPSPWRGSGAEALPIAADALGLRAGWRGDIQAALGGYDAMFARNLGDGSGLKLAPGANALWPEGMLLIPRAN